eukprot:scaffold107_cov54-Attheya_sp.AAC.5
MSGRQKRMPPWVLLESQQQGQQSAHAQCASHHLQPWVTCPSALLLPGGPNGASRHISGDHPPRSSWQVPFSRRIRRATRDAMKSMTSVGYPALPSPWMPSTRFRCASKLSCEGARRSKSRHTETPPGTIPTDGECSGMP